MNETKFIHYGSDSFDVSKVYPIRQTHDNKPMGGLWSCPANSNLSWYNFVKRTGLRGFSLDKHFTFKLNKNAKLLIVDSVSDLLALPMFCINQYDIDCNEKTVMAIDFVRISNELDAIWFTDEIINIFERIHKRYTLPSLHGYDCETLMVFNPNVIVCD